MHATDDEDHPTLSLKASGANTKHPPSLIATLGVEPAITARLRAALSIHTRAARLRSLGAGSDIVSDARHYEAILVRDTCGDVETIAHIHRAAPLCALVVLTSCSTYDYKLIAAGAQDVVDVETELEEVPQIVWRAIRRARAQAELCESRERLRATFEAMTSGVLVMSKDGRIQDANSAALSILGFCDTTPVVGKRLSDLIPSASAIGGLRETERQSLAIPSEDGGTRWLGYSSSETTSQGSRVIVFRDLTHIRTAEERRRRAEQLAQVGEVAARLGHEIKNPLASVQVGMQIVQASSELPAPLREIVQCSLEELQVAAKVIDELLSHARFASLSPQLVSAPAMIYDAIEPYRGFFARKSVSLLVEIPDDPEVWLAADPAWLRRAFTNLLVNAVDACGRGGRVSVTIRILSADTIHQRFPGFGGGVVGIRVTDNGPGISAREMERIFEPFYTTKASGTGLGLAVALDALEAHGGIMDVASIAGGGACFEMLLPLVDATLGDCSAENWPCGDRPIGIAHGCWMALGHEQYVRSGAWPMRCRGCSVFQSSNLRWVSAGSSFPPPLET